jgi:hypothetical protein
MHQARRHPIGMSQPAVAAALGLIGRLAVRIRMPALVVARAHLLAGAVVAGQP